MSKSYDENMCKACNTENWFIIVQNPILETKPNVRAGGCIRMMYDTIKDKISAFNFGFHPLAPKIFKSGNRNCK